MIVKFIEAAVTPETVASQLLNDGREGLLAFESQAGGGRWSLFLWAPDQWLIERHGTFWSYPGGVAVDDPYRWIREQERELDDSVALSPTFTTAELPFAGGLAGYLSFEFGWRLDEFSSSARHGELPSLYIGRYERGLVYDHRYQAWRDRKSVV